MRALSALLDDVSRRLSCLISAARASSVSRSPNSSSSCAAVFGPMPGTPGTLSTESPVSACRSIIFSGGTPHFSMTSGTLDLAVLHRVVHRHRRADELHQILVGRDDGGVAAGLAGEPRIGGDQIVGLEALHLDAGQVEGARRLADQAELRDQILRRRRAVGLVFGVELVAERLRRIVEDDREMGRRDADIGVARVLHQLPQHVAEARHRADRQPVRFARQRRQRVIGAEDVAGAVDEEEMIAFFHGRTGSAGALPCPCQSRSPSGLLTPGRIRRSRLRYRTCNVRALESPRSKTQIITHRQYIRRVRNKARPPPNRTTVRQPHPPLRAAASFRVRPPWFPPPHGGFLRFLGLLNAHRL